MRQLITTVLLTLTILSSVNAGDKFGDLTKEYLYGKNSKVSVEIRRVIAKDPQTAKNTLMLLVNDKDEIVRKFAKENLAY